jgi:predicted nucleic acid-binding protein
MTTILDTNVVSELALERPNPVVLDWWYRQVSDEMFTTAITEAEIRFGIAIMPAGRRRNRRASRADYLLRVFFENRILPFDTAAAQIYADISAQRRAVGLHIDIPDAQIAAIARSQDMSVATRNVSDFTDCGIEIVNPWSTEGTPQ